MSAEVPPVVDAPARKHEYQTVHEASFFDVAEDDWE